MKKIILLLAVAAFTLSPLAVPSAQAGQDKHAKTTKHEKHARHMKHHHAKHKPA